VVAGCSRRSRLPSVVIMTTSSGAPLQDPATAPAIAFVRRRPVTAFLLGAYGFGWPLLTVATVTGRQHGLAGYAFTFGALLGSALIVSRLADGPGGARRLLARFLIWRIGVGRWALVVAALPALTIGIAAASGTLQTPSGGWPAAGGAYLFQLVVVGALGANLAEEGAWSGVVQTRLTARHGLFRGAMLTAPLFAAMHLPLQFGAGWTWSSVVVGVTALMVIAPFFRYVLGETLVATGGSLLAVGVLHASLNASGSLDLPGGWQSLPAVMLLAVLVAIARRVRARRSRSVPAGTTVPGSAA
jgi:membrane protease YdiL (CAAX protease family)